MCLLHSFRNLLAKILIPSELKIKNLSVSERFWKSSSAEATSLKGLAPELIKLSCGVTCILYSSQNVLILACECMFLEIIGRLAGEHLQVQNQLTTSW